MGKRVKNALRGVALISVVAATRGASGRRAGDRRRAAISAPSLAPAPLGVFGDALPGAGNLLITLSPQFVGSANSLIGAQRRLVAADRGDDALGIGIPKLPLRLVPQRRLDETAVDDALLMASPGTSRWF